jgi:hypothetical protein
MNKYFFLRTLPIFLSLLAAPLAYGIQDGDLNDNGIPDSQENSQSNTGAQSQPLSKQERKAAKKKAKRERKARKLERKAAKKEVKGKTEKAAKLRQKAQEKREKNQGTGGVMNDNNNNGIPDDVE